MTLQDKVVLITGAGRGIGKSAALRFAADGAKLALVSRTLSEIEHLRDEIIASGGTAIAVQTDITNEEQVNSMVATTEAELGPIDILINNAGILALKPLIETPLDLWNQILNTNVTGVFLCSKAVMPGMMDRKSGRIINIGSLAGRRGYPEQGAYCTSKHALVGLSKVLAVEGQKYGIKVNMVSPGGVLTDLSKGLLGTRSASEANEWMTAEEVADGIYYIATQDGPATTDELVLRRFASDPWR